MAVRGGFVLARLGFLLMTPATFYTVNGPRGVYYAVRNHHTGMVWTERTESAAQQQAQEEGLAIIAGQTINHQQLLDLMIRVPENSPGRLREAPVVPVEAAHVAGGVKSGLSRFLQRLRRGHHASDKR